MKKINKKNKRALSTIVTTIILIALTIGAISVVWVFVNKTLNKQMAGASSCSDLYGKITINGGYTCYDFTDTRKQLRVSIDIKDVEAEEILFSVASAGQTKSFKIKDEATSFPYLKNYEGETFGEEVELPGENAGKTYVVSLKALFGDSYTGTKVDSIKIAPVIDGEQCEATDALSQIDSCVLLG